MPPRIKKTIKKQQERIVVIETREVALNELNVFHKNPNVGNVDLIAKSLHINGLFRPIVVNVGTKTKRPNEILAGNHCVDDQTEALTQRGWVNGHELREDDTILSCDSDGVLRWSKINGIFRNHQYDGQMHYWHNRNSLNALVSPGHKFLESNGRLTPIEELVGKSRQIRVMGEGIPSESDIYTDSFVELVGWAVTEGNFRPGIARGGSVRIAQKDGYFADQIEQCLKSVRASYVVGRSGTASRGGVKMFNVSGPVALELIRVAPNKVMTWEFLLALSSEQRHLLIDTMIYADGHYTNTVRHYTQRDKTHMDMFIALCSMSGIATRLFQRTPPVTDGEFKNSKPYWVASLHQRKTAHTDKQHHDLVPYKGLIWCPNTDYGTFVCRREGHVYVTGNTYLAARKPLFWQQGGETYDKPAWDTILCSFVDVSETEAAQIVAVDNRAAQEGRIDDEVLYSLFKDLPELNVSGTGFSEKDLSDMMGKFDMDDLPTITVDDMDLELPDREPVREDTPVKPKFDEVVLGDEIDADDAEDRPTLSLRQQEEMARQDGLELENVASDLPGALQLSDDAIFDDYVISKRGNQYPRLLTSMLMQPEDLPADRSLLSTWAGSATRDDDNPNRVWLYNYGIDSTSGMLDKVMKNMIVSFFTWDEYFERWWNTPSRYVGKVLNTKIKFIGIPDYTPSDGMGNIFQYWQLFKARYLARYFQEAGLKLVPHVTWPDEDKMFLAEESLSTMPDHVPVLLLQMQTINMDHYPGGMQRYLGDIQLILDTLTPEVALVYCAEQGREIFEKVDYDGEAIFLITRQTLLTEWNKENKKTRKRKSTL